MHKSMRFDEPLGRRAVRGRLSVLRRVAYLMAVLACLMVWADAMLASVWAELTDISPNLARQLRAVIAEKKSRTVAQQKIDPFLLMAVKQQRGEAIPWVAHGVDVAADGLVVVEIQCPVTGTVADAIAAMGGTVLTSHPRYDRIRARMPLSQLETLASKSMVRSVRLPVPMVTRQGAVRSEGDRAHRAAEVRSTFGLDGSGITVCAISDGVDQLAARQAAGELPMDVQILAGQAGVGTEGTALLEIIHDMVPGAHLAFATARFSPAQFATNIRDLADVVGCDIIVDDVGYLNQSPFQAGPISQAVEAVVASGVVYISAAGNDGSQAKGTSGTYEGDYVDSGVDVETLLPGLSVSGSLHGFPTDSGPNVANELMTFGFGIALHWNDPLGGSANDYDLCLTDATLSTLLRCANAIQDGDDDPFEFIAFAPAGSRAIIINMDDAAQDRFLHLQAFGGILEVGTRGAIFGHPGTEAAIAVGAADVKQAGTGHGVFGPEDTIEVEAFSSDGPRRVFFDADGNPFTPGDFTSTGGIVRQKPDVTAADGVTTTTPGFETFFGTSAAAPHVTGVAALLLQADPTLTPAQIKTILGRTALDIEANGPDDVSGFGIIDAFDAVDALDGSGVEQIINDALTLDNLDTAFDPHDRQAPAGVLTIEATFTNTSPDSFRDVYFRLDAGVNQVLNADSGLGGEGARISGPDRLDAGDTFDVVFEIGLQEASPLRLLVEVYGTPHARSKLKPHFVFSRHPQAKNKRREPSLKPFIFAFDPRQATRDAY